MPRHGSRHSRRGSRHSRPRGSRLKPPPLCAFRRHGLPRRGAGIRTRATAPAASTSQEIVRRNMGVLLNPNGWHELAPERLMPIRLGHWLRATSAEVATCLSTKCVANGIPRTIPPCTHPVGAYGGRRLSSTLCERPRTQGTQSMAKKANDSDSSAHQSHASGGEHGNGRTVEGSFQQGRGRPPRPGRTGTRRQAPGDSGARSGEIRKGHFDEGDFGLQGQDRQDPAGQARPQGEDGRRGRRVRSPGDAPRSGGHQGPADSQVPQRADRGRPAPRWSS